MKNRGHGTTDSLSTFSGIEINVEMLKGVTVHPAEKTATLQAGPIIGDVVNKLWDQGFVASKCICYFFVSPLILKLLATGSAACVGMMGAALGGGHGRYEGLYGLIQDNIVHYNVVLGIGTEIGVNDKLPGSSLCFERGWSQLRHRHQCRGENLSSRELVSEDLHLDAG